MSGVAKKLKKALDVRVAFEDGSTVVVDSASPDTTIAELRQTVSAICGRTVAQLFDENGGEEPLDDCRTLRGSGLTSESALVALLGGGTFVVAESLGPSCTASDFRELGESESGAMASATTLSLCGCTSIAGLDWTELLGGGLSSPCPHLTSLDVSYCRLGTAVSALLCNAIKT
jgi:hypothetical protein